MAERLDRFMARAAAAYYATATPFGRDGDFTTAPEISQAFGECLGLWGALAWEGMGRPNPVVLAELGPGRGTLLADALRAIGDVAPAFAAAVRVHLMETAPALIAAQRDRLGAAVVAWHGAVEALPAGPAIILANEFLDALPIRQLVRRDGVWRERHVTAGGFVELPTAATGGEAPEGAIRELGEAREAIATALGARLALQGGAALLLDYGYAEAGPGDTLQAVAAHRPVDPLAAPGTVDISAHVDFAAFASAARAAGAGVYGPVPQGVLLQRLGFATRSAALAAAAVRAGRPDQARLALASAQRLMAAEAMGRLFKAICLCHPSLPIPAGFAPA